MWFYLAVLAITVLAALPFRTAIAARSQPTSPTACPTTRTRATCTDLPRSDRTNSRQVMLYLLIVFIVLAGISGLRSFSVGTDTSYYATAYDDISRHGIDGLAESHYEVGYYLLNLLFGLIAPDYRALMFFEAVVTVGLVLFFIYKSSLNSVVSVVLFQELYYFCGMMNISRGWLGLAIGLAGFHLVARGKLVAPLALVVLGSLFHTSTAILAVVYVLIHAFRKSSDGTALVASLCALSITMVSPAIAALVAALAPRYGYYLTSYTGHEATSGVYPLLILLTVLALLVTRSNGDGRKAGGSLLGAECIALAAGAGCLFATSVLHIAVRVSLYFLVLLVVFIPLGARESRYGSMIQWGFIAVMTCYYINQLAAGSAGVIPYSTWLF